ncbi:hypothetical protein FPZ12_041565 [Amycolatopsis acidicola]|uniref:Uncharacterized protein n=1 Tax=Amycolatopsis acidicola TaxID=2596893 RepID=A0A5N0ULV0_9PSEU|nr:hypothetical protein [Amycolatopsis acidicola]KAA9150265.1 hypothetical protein FPZ12_041565 [Amycolatopsis acidicola]
MTEPEETGVLDPLAPAEDVLEQRQDVTAPEAEAQSPDLGLDADPADVADQRRIVGDDEEDYD